MSKEDAYETHKIQEDGIRCQAGNQVAKYKVNLDHLTQEQIEEFIRIMDSEDNKNIKFNNGSN